MTFYFICYYERNKMTPKVMLEKRSYFQSTFTTTNFWVRNRSAGFHNKQLLDEIFVISRIIKVEVGVISRNRRLIILDITKTK